METMVVRRNTFRLKTRTFKINESNKFKIPSVGMIQQWEIKNITTIDKKKKKCNFNKDTVQPIFCIGNMEIVPFNQWYECNIISVKKLRNYIRDIMFPENETDQKMLLLENVFYEQQIKGTEYYYSLTNEELFDSLFTKDLNIYIELKNVPFEYEIEIEETYWEKNN